MTSESGERWHHGEQRRAGAGSGRFAVRGGMLTLLCMGIALAPYPAGAQALQQAAAGAQPSSEAPPAAGRAALSAAPRLHVPRWRPPRFARRRPPFRGNSPPRSAEWEGPTRWYGWQNLSADGAALLLVFGGVALESGGSSALAAVSYASALGTYVLASPIIHAAHAGGGKSWISLGLRLGLPPLGGALGHLVTSGCDGFLCQVEGAGVGVLIGLCAAVATDAIWLAREPLLAEPGTEPGADAGVVPVLARMPGGGWLGVAAVF